MRASRLVAMLLTLQARGRVTATALAEACEVSIRTVYRDVDALCASGVPVVADRGPGGGFWLQDGYRTHLTGLTTSEVSTLLLAGLPGPMADLGLDDERASAERKVLAALPQKDASLARLTRDRILLDPVAWYQRAERPPLLTVVARAVWTSAQLVLRYRSWTRLSTHTVDPFGLVIKGGTWYLVARHRRGLTTYRVSQIESCTPTGVTAEVPADFDLATHWHTHVRAFEQSLHQGTATVRVGPSALSRIGRLGAEATDAVMAAEPDARGWRTATIPVEGVEHAVIELLGFGAQLEVLEPAALRRRVAQEVDRLSAAYGDARVVRRRRPRSTRPARSR